MNLLDKIKSILNIGSEESRSTDRRTRTDVPSYESNRSDVSSNQETDRKADTGTTAREPPTESETDGHESTDDSEETVVATAGVDAEPEMETDVEGDAEPEMESDTEADAEPEMEADTETESVETDTVETDAEPAVESETEPEAVESEPSEPVDVIKGVGSTYAQTLGEAGIETVDELAAADPETLAEQTDISPKRIDRWVGRAQHR